MNGHILISLMEHSQVLFLIILDIMLQNLYSSSVKSRLGIV